MSSRRFGALVSKPSSGVTKQSSKCLEFAKKLTAANDREDFLAVVDRWGVRRTNPEFWSVFHSATDYMRRSSPKSAAVFDLNRYRDF
jgi:hypothetical protein